MKKWINKTDVDSGRKRVNLTLNIPLCHKIVVLSAQKNIRPTTYISMIVYEMVISEYNKMRPDEINQTSLFSKKRGKK